LQGEHGFGSYTLHKVVKAIEAGQLSDAQKFNIAAVLFQAYYPEDPYNEETIRSWVDQFQDQANEDGVDYLAKTLEIGNDPAIQKRINEIARGEISRETAEGEETPFPKTHERWKHEAERLRSLIGDAYRDAGIDEYFSDDEDFADKVNKDARALLADMKEGRYSDPETRAKQMAEEEKKKLTEAPAVQPEVTGEEIEAEQGEMDEAEAENAKLKPYRDAIKSALRELLETKYSDLIKEGFSLKDFEEYIAENAEWLKGMIDMGESGYGSMEEGVRTISRNLEWVLQMVASIKRNETASSSEQVVETKPETASEEKNAEEEPFQIKEGDFVQWTSQGVDQFETPRKISGFSEDGKLAFVEGGTTGVPVEQLHLEATREEEEKEQKERELARENEMRAAAVPVKYEGDEYLAEKIANDPIVRFWKEKGLSDEDIRKITIVYHVLAPVAEPEKDKEAFDLASASNYHDIERTRGKLKPEDRERFDSEVRKIRGVEFGNGMNVDVVFDSEFVGRLTKGDLRKYAEEFTKFLVGVRMGQEKDTYAESVERKLAEEAAKEKSEKKAGEEEPEGKKEEAAEPAEAGAEKEEARKERSDAEKNTEQYFKDTFGFKDGDLDKIEGYKDLTDGQKRLVYENLRQVTLGRIKEEARGEFKEDLENAGVLKLGGNGRFAKFDKALGRVWLGATKHYHIAKLEKKSANDILTGGLKTHGEILQQLVKGTKELGLDAHIENGQVEIDYVAEKDLTPANRELQPAERELISKFNEAAREFARTPAEWNYSGASKFQNTKYWLVERNFRNLKKKIFDLRLLENGRNRNEAELYVNTIDERLRANQLFGSNPDIEEELLNIKDRKVWKKVLKDIVTERGIISAAGFLSRSTAMAIGGVTMLPFAAAGVGFVTGRSRTRGAQAERAEDMRRGARASLRKDEFKALAAELDAEKKKLRDLKAGAKLTGTRDAKNDVEAQQAKVNRLAKKFERKTHMERNFVPAEVLVNKIDDLEREFDSVNSNPKFESEKEKDAERERIMHKLKVRLFYTRQKLNRGLVSFGVGEGSDEIAERLREQLELRQKLSEAGTFLAMFEQNRPGKKSTDLAEKTERATKKIKGVLSWREKRINSAQAWQARRGGMRSAAWAFGLSALGQVAHNLLWEHHGTEGEFNSVKDRLSSMEQEFQKVKTGLSNQLAEEAKSEKALKAAMVAHQHAAAHAPAPAHAAVPPAPSAPAHEVPPPPSAPNAEHAVPPPPSAPAAPKEGFTLHPLDQGIVKGAHKPFWDGTELSIYYQGNASPEQMTSHFADFDQYASQISHEGMYAQVPDMRHLREEVEFLSKSFGGQRPELQQEILVRVQDLHDKLITSGATGRFDSQTDELLHIINERADGMRKILSHEMGSTVGLEQGAADHAAHEATGRAVPSHELHNDGDISNDVDRMRQGMGRGHHAPPVHHEGGNAPIQPEVHNDGDISNDSTIGSPQGGLNQTPLENLQPSHDPVLGDLHRILGGKEYEKAAKVFSHAEALDQFAGKGITPENAHVIAEDLGYISRNIHDQPLLAQDEVMKHVATIQREFPRMRMFANPADRTEFLSINASMREIIATHQRTVEKFNDVLQGLKYKNGKHAGYGLEWYRNHIAGKSSHTVGELRRTYIANHEDGTENPFVDWVYEKLDAKDVSPADNDALKMPLDEFIRGRLKPDGFGKSLLKSFQNTARIEAEPLHRYGYPPPPPPTRWPFYRR
jgi:hypothetical protein